MRRLFPTNTLSICSAIFTLLIGLSSCRKDHLNFQPSLVDITKLNDSCSYTLDGVPYVCDNLYTMGEGNSGANLDTSGGKWKWDADTILYSRKFGINSTNPNGPLGGNLVITFIQKFAKSQLTTPLSATMFAPAYDTLMYYPKGPRPFAMDFARFNSQSGVAIEVVTGSVGTSKQYLTSYSTEMVSLPTTITNNSQANSKFEITNVYFFPANGTWMDSHIIEVKFHALLFDGDEKPHQLANGYLRIHI